MSGLPRDIEPRLLPIIELKQQLSDKGVLYGETWSRDQLVDAYLKYVQPKPQRQNSKSTPNSSILAHNKSIIPKRVAANDCEGDEKRHKSDHPNDLVSELRANLSRTKLNETSPTKKIILKRTRIETTTTDNVTDNVKKTKPN